MSLQLNPWDDEYRRKGIPSSYRDEPSGVLLWALSCWPHVHGSNRPQRALDIGCGTGRNALHLASIGVDVAAFDGSAEAIRVAAGRLESVGGDAAGRVTFSHRALQEGLPAEPASVDLASDIFVYKHQMAPSARAAYRQELRRVLRPEGVLLLSLAERSDGYYASCPPAEGYPGDLAYIVDPVAGVGSVLFTLDELVSEMSDQFALEMAWVKRKQGTMHGSEYLRVTLATLWRPT